MENIKIEDYQDYVNVTNAQYHAAIGNLDKAIEEAFKNGQFKKIIQYKALRFEISKLFNKRLAHSAKYGYDSNKKHK